MTIGLWHIADLSPGETVKSWTFRVSCHELVMDITAKFGIMEFAHRDGQAELLGWLQLPIEGW